MKACCVLFDRRTLLVLLATMCCAAWSLTNATAAEAVRKFQETDETFANPGQGWMTTRRLPDGPGRFPRSVAYFRLNWEDIEPVEGQYSWQLIDEPLAAWAKREVRIAFRIMTTNAHTKGYYCSPKWLFDAGCKSYDYVAGGADIASGGARITRIEPDYGDPVYLEKHSRFIKALAERYDGNPQIEFIDIGSYGIWGEWHTKHPQPWPVRKQIIDMYLDGFRKTQLASMSDDAEGLAYALTHGTGFRRDGVGSPWHEANWIGSKKYALVEGFADQWKRAPVVFEWFGPYDYLIQRGWSFDRALDFMAANHVTFINDNVGKVPTDQMPKLEQMVRRAGYRFVLREISHPESLARGETLTVNMKWSNVGVGKLYRRYPLVLYLLDSKGAIVCQQRQADIDVTSWLPGDRSVAATLPLPTSLQAGLYTLGLALVDRTSEKPAIRLAIDAPQTDQLYRLSSIRVDLAAVRMATTTERSLSQYGITWTFAQPASVGRFATGDWWVVGPVTVQSVSPAPTADRHGSVVNPPAGDKQGYDARLAHFDMSLRVQFPLSLKPGESLVSTASVDAIGDRTADTVPGQYCRGPLRTAAVLTCVAAPPSGDAFRPAYAGTWKTMFTVSQLRRDRLPRLQAPGTVPDVKPYERYLERIWLDHQREWVNRMMHPLENMPDYGREITNIVSDVGLLVLLDDPDRTRETLLLRFVQKGIDYYGVVQSDDNLWIGNGGHNSGRKWPILFAGLMLGHEGMSHVKATFQEDQQTYYGPGYRGQKALWTISPGNPNARHEEVAADRWETFGDQRGNDGTKAEGYRKLNGPTWVGEALAARLTGMVDGWNHPAFFDYVDRWWEEEEQQQQANDFVKAMWQRYRQQADQIGATVQKNP